MRKREGEGERKGRGRTERDEGKERKGEMRDRRE